MATRIVDVREKAEKLPPTTKVVNVTYTDPESGLSQSGEFTIKRLNLGDIRQVAIRKAQLCGGLSEGAIDSKIAYFNQMLAHLEFALYDTPKWWRPEEFFDGEVVVDVYEEVMRFEESFRVSVGAQSPENKADSQVSAQFIADNASAVVEQEVSTPANL